MYNWSFLFVVLHKPTLLPNTFNHTIHWFHIYLCYILQARIQIHDLYGLANLWWSQQLYIFRTLSYSLNKKEWICSLFKEWIVEKSEIRVNLEWTFVLFTHFGVTTGITQGFRVILRSLQNEWITQMFTPNSL